MDEGRLDRAIARIESAARRIAVAGANLGTTASASELGERHERLRAQATAALEELDRLILELDH